MDLQNESGNWAARPPRRYLLLVCLAASAALHAAVALFVTLPALDEPPAPPRVLEVVLVQSEMPRPLPVEPEETPQTPPPKRSAPERSADRKQLAVAEPPPRSEMPRPVLALPESAMSPEPAAVVPQAVEKRPPVAESRAEVANVAPTSPSFSAAYLRNPAPRYPMEARRAGEQGTVTLRVLVTRDGRPARVVVEKSSGSARLDAAALDAVKDWRFVPARQGPETIESWVLVPIVFRLEGVS